MKIEFDTVECWKACIQRLIELNADFAAGNTEDKSITIYDLSFIDFELSFTSLNCLPKR
jgi:hypothetical protein